MRIFLALVLLAAVARAQDEDPRKRMVFPAGAAAPEPSPVAAPAPKQRTAEPGELIASFFLALKSGQVEAAYDSLIRNTIISERQENARELMASTKKAIDGYGPVAGYEVVDTLQVGTCLVRQTCVSLNKDLPLRWRFYFYRTGGVWKIVDIRVDDGLVELFDEAGRRKKD
jgi:hypothetical protein